jgi:hypothetical protein
MRLDNEVGNKPGDEALPEVLMRIVSELHDVAYLVERIEPQIANTEHPGMLQESDRIKVLQGIDLAVQKTRGLAEFIDTITAGIPENWLIDTTIALSLVKLAEMQRALSAGHQRHGHSQPISKASGDFEFF